MRCPWRRFRISTRCGMGCFFCLLGMKNAACCSGLFHPHTGFDVAKIRNNIQTCKHSIIFLRFIFILCFRLDAGHSSLQLCLPTLEAVMLSLLVGFPCMRSGRTVDAAMMFNTKCLKIRRIETELLHLLECSGRFTRSLVVDINGRSHEAFSLAQFAEWILLELPLS